MSKIRVSCSSLLLLLSISMCAANAYAASETLSSYSRQGNSYPDSEYVAVAATVKCTSAYGASSGTARCYINAPGYQGTLDVGQSIGTTGAGTVQLTCSGTYPATGMLSCTAVIDDSACATTQNLSAYSSQGSTYGENAPIFSSSTVTCNRASGARPGSTARCFIKAPGYQGTLNVGQSVGANGPGTVQLTCSGTYPAGGTLSCGARVVQTCP